MKAEEARNITNQSQSVDVIFDEIIQSIKYAAKEGESSIDFDYEAEYNYLTEDNLYELKRKLKELSYSVNRLGGETNLDATVYTYAYWKISW